MRPIPTLVFLLLASAAQADAPVLTGAVWSVCGDDGVYTWHDTRLTFTQQTPNAEDGADRLVGFFDWQSSGGHFGREQFTGFITDDGALVLQGQSLEDTDYSIVTSRYEAQVNAEGTVSFDGVWLDGAPGIWAATRDGGAGTGTSLCDLADQIS